MWQAGKRLKQARARFESFDETDLIVELRESGEYDSLFDQIFNEQQPAPTAVVEDAAKREEAVQMGAAQPIRSVDPSSHYCSHPQLHCQRQPTTAGVPMAGCSSVLGGCSVARLVDGLMVAGAGIQGIQWILTSP